MNITCIYCIFVSVTVYLIWQLFFTGGDITTRAFTLVLGTVPAGTCSRNMFSVHTISSSMNDVLKRIVPARTVPAGTWSNHVLGTNRPLSTHPKQVWTLVYREQCSKWAGLSTQTVISTESAHQNDLTRCAVYTQYVILRRPRCVPFSTWTNGYREHFTVLVIWTLVYREHVPRTFCRGCVPRTYIWTGSMSIR